MNANVGYRQMWIIFKRTNSEEVCYKNICIVEVCYRSNIQSRATVQMLMSILDPEGVVRRRGRRLKRRTYHNNVY